MEIGRTVKTSLSILRVSFDEAFFGTYALFELNVDRIVGDAYNKKYEAMTAALIAIRNGDLFRHSLSSVFRNPGKVYLLCEKKDAPLIHPSLKGTNVTCRRIFSETSVALEILCDLSLKFEVLKTMPATCVLQRARGVYHKYSEEMVVSVFFKAIEDAPGQVILCASGQNIRKTNRTKGSPFPFIFTPSGIMIYPGDEFADAQRYEWKTQDDGNLAKTRAITFSKDESETSKSKLLHMSNALRLLNNTHGLTASPIVWEGVQYAKRIGSPTEDYADMEKAAIAMVMERGITIRRGKGASVHSVETLKKYFDLLVSYSYKQIKFKKAVGEKISRILVKHDRILMLKAARGKKFLPVNSSDGWTNFELGGAKVSSVIVYTLDNITDGMEAILYDEEGEEVDRGILMPDKNEKVWRTGRSAVRKGGSFVIEVIQSKAQDIPYEKSLDVQHITEDVIDGFLSDKRSGLNTILALCRNLVYQLVIKADIQSGKFTFVQIPAFAEHEFLYASRGRFAFMKVIDGSTFTIGKMSLGDEIRFREMQKIGKSGEYYAIKSPSGNMTVIEDSGITIMADPSFTADNAKSRSNKEENDILAPFMDYIYYENHGEQYYTAGWDLVDDNGQQFDYIPRVRHLKSDSGDKWDMALLFDTMNVPFVRMSQKNTVVPFPFKYLREYAFTVLEEEKADLD